MKGHTLRLTECNVPPTPIKRNFLLLDMTITTKPIIQHRYFLLRVQVPHANGYFAGLFMVIVCKGEEKEGGGITRMRSCASRTSPPPLLLLQCAVQCRCEATYVTRHTLRLTECNVPPTPIKRSRLTPAQRGYRGYFLLRAHIPHTNSLVITACRAGKGEG
jgi:hypothetical protein